MAGKLGKLVSPGNWGNWSHRETGEAGLTGELGKLVSQENWGNWFRSETGVTGFAGELGKLVSQGNLFLVTLAKIFVIILVVKQIT